MEDFFSTIYYYTNGFYDQLLDTYLYETIPGYLHVGIFLLISTAVVSAFFYYLLAPVRKQTMWWFIYLGINATINISIALWYTMTPLINNEIDPDDMWTYLDCFGFSIANTLWSILFFIIISLLIKWGSIAKYIPFQKF